MAGARTAVLLALLALAGCGGASDSTASGGAGQDGRRGHVALVAFSAPQVVYDEVVPAFGRTPEGRGVAVSASYGASGEQSRAVRSGLPADVVAFALAPDVDRLVAAGLVAPGWDRTPTHGLVSTSVVALVVRRGNPKRIRDWADLLRDGVEVLTPNPATSGAAKWNLLAAYGAAGDRGADPARGLAYLRELLGEHVRVQDESAREAMQSFSAGTGDVLISYENEAITARRKGIALDYVVPDRTIAVEHPIAVVAASRAPRQARAFVDFALSAPAQERLAAWGYRPVDRAVRRAHAARFPSPAGLFTVADLGGWDRVDRALFDPDAGAVTRIAQGREAAGDR